MFKKLLITLFITILVFSGFYLGFIYLTKTSNTDNTTVLFEESLIRDTFELPIQKRSYRIGINVDSKSLKEEIALSEVISINIPSYNLTSIAKILDSTKADVNLVVIIEDDLIKGSSDEFIKNISFYLETYKQIKYLSIGSSVNLSYIDNKKYSTFISEYTKIYDGLKKDYPAIKIYTTFQYETLIGKANDYYSDTNWEYLKFLDDLSGKYDLIGLNSLPIINYVNPNEIPLNYFEPLAKYGKKLALIQASWPARDLIDKDGKAYVVSSDLLQGDYLKKLTQIFDSTKCELLIWYVYQDDLEEKEVEDYGSYTVSLGMKTLSGQDRSILKLWRELKNVEYSSI